MIQGVFKKILFALTLIAAPFFASAAALHIGSDYFLKGSEHVLADVYVVAPSVAFSGSVGGDAVALGRVVASDGTIGGDALFLGESATVTGDIADDARIAAGTVFVRGKIAGDAVLVGARIRVEKDAVVSGDLYAVGGEIVMDGAVHGAVKVAGGDVRISGAVSGAVEAWGEKILLAPGAFLGGDFIYHAPREATVAPDVRIGGETLFDEQKGARSGFASLAPGFVPFQLLAMLAGAFFLFFLFRERTEEILLDAAENFWMRVLRGLLLFLIVPIASAFLFLTAVGIPLGIALVALYLAGGIFSTAYGGMLIGVLLERQLFRRSAFPLSPRTVFVGVALLALLGAVPYLGFAALFLLTLASFGSVGTIGWRRLKDVR